jgi:hypothetical protein
MERHFVVPYDPSRYAVVSDEHGFKPRASIFFSTAEEATDIAERYNREEATEEHIQRHQEGSPRSDLRSSAGSPYPLQFEIGRERGLMCIVSWLTPCFVPQ